MLADELYSSPVGLANLVDHVSLSLQVVSSSVVVLQVLPLTAGRGETIVSSICNISLMLSQSPGSLAP